MSQPVPAWPFAAWPLTPWPLTAWTRLIAASASMADSAWRAAETITASGRVIDSRARLMQSAMVDPPHADHAELGRMVPEKFAAFTTAGGAVMAGWLAWNQAVLAETLHWATLAARGRPPSAGELMTLAARGAEFGLAATERSIRVGAEAIAPVHAKATANARRLGRRKGG